MRFYVGLKKACRKLPSFPFEMFDQKNRNSTTAQLSRKKLDVITI